MNKGAEYWMEVAEWGNERRLLSPKDLDIIRFACMMPIKMPSDKQSQVIVKIEEKLKKEGFYYSDGG